MRPFFALLALIVAALATIYLVATNPPPRPPEVSTAITFYVIYVRGCDFLGQGPGMDETVYSEHEPLVSFPQPGAVNAFIPRYWVEKRGYASGEVFFEAQPAYQIRVAGVPCVVNWVNEKRELPVRK